MDNRKREFIDEKTAKVNILNYIENNVLIPICDTSHANCMKEIESYFEKNKSDYSKTKECGRTWIMLKKRKQCYVAITLGQSQDIKNEIKGIVRAMFSLNDTDRRNILYYRELKKKERNLYFYEVDIDLFVRLYCNQLFRESQNNLFYEICKDYFAEAILAYNTAAKEWDYSFGGMDKRFYFHLMNELCL